MSSVLQIMGALAGIVATYYIQKVMRKWLQARQDSKNEKESVAAGSQAASEAAKREAAHKNLKEKERGYFGQ